MKNSASLLSSMMQAILVNSPGGINQLYVGNVPTPLLKKSEVLIKVMSSGLNRMDILQREGKYPVPPDAGPILGVECSGFVEESLSQQFSKGDKVMTLVSGGAYSQYVASPDAFCMKIPKNLSFEEAASIPEVWLTAFQLMHSVASIKKGDNILIHAAASGVGCAAIQLAKLFEANHIIATSRSSDKLNYCKTLGATSVISAVDNKFADEVLKITNGKGVDIILDCIGTSYFEENFKSCCLDARWILYGLMGGAQVNFNFGKILFKRVSIRTSALRNRSFEYKANLIDEFKNVCLKHFESGFLKANVDSTFSFKNVADAHQYMEQNKNIGKIILNF